MFFQVYLLKCELEVALEIDGKRVSTGSNLSLNLICVYVLKLFLETRLVSVNDHSNFYLLDPIPEKKIS